MIKQVAVFVENKPGSLRDVTAALHEKKVNIHAFAYFDTPEFCIFRMIADKPKEVKSVLTAKGCVTKICDVIAVELEDELGGLDGLLDTLADSNISINYTYTSFRRKHQIPVVILYTEDIFESESILKRKGFHILTDIEELNG